MTSEIKDIQDAVKILDRIQNEVWKERVYDSGNRCDPVWTFIWHAQHYLEKREEQLFREALDPPEATPVKSWFKRLLQ